MRDSGRKKTGAVSTNGDESAVLDALLADLAMIQDRFPTLSLYQYRALLEVIQAERRGMQHTIASLARHVQLPLSSASRIVWQLTMDGGDVALLRYENHPSDRRRKYVRILRGGAEKVLPVALLETMNQRSARKTAKT